MSANSEIRVASVPGGGKMTPYRDGKLNGQGMGCSIPGICGAHYERTG